MSRARSIVYWNRSSRSEETETVYGDKFVRWIYGNRLGQKLAESLLSRPFLSRLSGWFMSSRASRIRVGHFIRRLGIETREFEDRPYTSFNDFFSRKFVSGARPFVANNHEFPAIAEARYLAYEKVETDQALPVKGQLLTPNAILGGHEQAAQFVGGPVIIARLCPKDYHRFHFPDSGRTLDYYRIRGRYHSVNPLALKYSSKIFSENERQVSILETQNFGRLAYVEVGALCVGKIIQTHSPDRRFLRGEEKGYFLFGASTVIVFAQPGALYLDPDLISYSRRGIETFVRLGERIALNIPTA